MASPPVSFFACRKLATSRPCSTGFPVCMGEADGARPFAWLLSEVSNGGAAGQRGDVLPSVQLQPAERDRPSSSTGSPALDLSGGRTTGVVVHRRHGQRFAFGT